MQRISHVLYNCVAEAVKPVSKRESEWSAGEMVKRITKYFCKGLALEMLSTPWRQATQSFVEGAMQGYVSACGFKPWFFELDLAPAVCAAAWELAKGSGSVGRGLRPRDVEQFAVAQYQDAMEAALLDKALWDVTEATFPEHAACGKICKTLRVELDRALADAKAMSRSVSDLQRVETFTRQWLENSMSRCLQSSFGYAPDTPLTPKSVVALFQGLLAPFGEDHPFSCVPPSLTERIGRPPREWPVLQDAVRRLFAAYGHPGHRGAQRELEAQPQAKKLRVKEEYGA